MDFSANALWILAFVTLALVAAVALWQRRATSKAKKEHHHSAITADRRDQRKSDGSEPGTKAH